MKVYALVGPSGTGKSHRASLLAHQLSVPLILDDGLLIKENIVLAGKSAKRESTRIAATRRAVFLDPVHAEEVKQGLEKQNSDKLLILATSERMAEAICQRLNIPSPCETLFINDIASDNAISKALEIRKKENRHVIPIPTFAIKKDFPGYLIDPVRSLLQKTGSNPRNEIIERSIVRPCYSSLGNLFIAEQVLESLVSNITGKCQGIHTARKVKIHSESGILNISLDVDIKQGADILQTLKEVQKSIRTNMEFITGFYIETVNVTAARLFVPK